jgi:hypothetical protein
VRYKVPQQKPILKFGFDRIVGPDSLKLLTVQFMTKTAITGNSMPTVAFATEPHPAPTPPDRRAAVLRDPGFGRVFTDHMVTIRYSEGKGWHDAKITPRRHPDGSGRRGAAL